SFLYAGVFGAVRKMAERNEKRRILLVILERMDAETTGKMKLLKNLLSASNIELFFLSYASKLTPGKPGQLTGSMSDASLIELAQTTTGEAFAALEYREHPDDIVRRLHNLLRTYYTFGFESESPAEAPAKLLIKCLRPGAKSKHHSVVPILQ